MVNINDVEITVPDTNLEKTLCEFPVDTIIKKFKETTIELSSGFLKKTKKAAYKKNDDDVDENDELVTKEQYFLELNKDPQILYLIETQKEKNDVHRIGYINRPYGVYGYVFSTVLESIAFGKDVNIGIDNKKMIKITDEREKLVKTLEQLRIENTQYQKTLMHVNNKDQSTLF